MYPTLNMSLLTQPTAAAGGDPEASPLLEGTDVDLAESFPASLARSLEPQSADGKPLPLEGTALPGNGLLAGADIEGDLLEALPAEATTGELTMPGVIVPDTVEVDISLADQSLDLPMDADNPARSLLPGIAAAAQAGDATASESQPESMLVGASRALRTQQAGQAEPPLRLRDAYALDPENPARTLVSTGDPQRGGEPGVPFEEAPELAVQSRLDGREVAAQRAELAAGLAEPQSQRPGEQRSGILPTSALIEPGAALASPTRPTINVASPAQLQVQQSASLDAPVQTPVGEPGFDDAIADRVWVMTQARLSNAEIRLTPAELGPVRIQLAVDDGTANVTFQAAQAATRDAIEQALPRLRELFAENGLSLGQASVGDDGVRDGNPEASEQGPAATLADDPGEDADNEAATAAAPRSRLATPSLVDTFA